MAATTSAAGSADAGRISKLIFDYAAGILGEQDQNRLLLLNANMARDICGADRCSIWLVDERSGELWTQVAHGIEQIRIPRDAGLVGACVRNDEVLLVNNTALDPRFLGRIDQKTGYSTQSVLVLPLRAEGKVIGALQLLNKPGGFSTHDVDLLKLAAAYSASAIQTQRLHREAEAARLLYRDLEIAREVQQRLLPTPSRDLKGLDYAFFCRPAKSVGGDYCDFLELPQGQLALTLGDVSGKGIAAAILMASLQASLRALVMQGCGDPATLIRDFNRAVRAHSTPDRYSTLFFTLLDLESRHITYVNAGQVAPMLLRKSGEIERLNEGGLPVGLLPFSTYQQGELDLGEGDTLLCMSDGITEAANVQDELWGEEEVEKILSESNTLACDDLVRRILQAADAYAAGAEQADDMTIVALRIR
jgi:sigma-B regulation protein RsbU (phosphoserine phosphatase)